MWEEALASRHAGEPLPIPPDPSFQSHVLEPPDPAAHWHFPDILNPVNGCPTVPPTTLFAKPGGASTGPGGHIVPTVYQDHTRTPHGSGTSCRPSPHGSYSHRAASQRRTRNAEAGTASKPPSTWNPSAPMPHKLTPCPKVPQGLLSVGLRAWGTLPTPQPTEASSSLTDHKVPTSLCPPDLLPSPKYPQY